ncbi:MAG: hypothetical protein J6X55_10065 [Victivallales bacterium]|nr:hypothetical protein [Victivallales bacterium]
MTSGQRLILGSLVLFMTFLFLGLYSLLLTSLHSMTLFSALLHSYAQCAPLLIICLSFHILPPIFPHIRKLRISSLVALFLSPFFTWEWSSAINRHFTISSILCVISMYYMTQVFCTSIHAISIPAQPTDDTSPPCPPSNNPDGRFAVSINGQHSLKIMALCTYWLVFFTVTAPFAAKLTDLVAYFIFAEPFPFRLSDIWNSSIPLLDWFHNLFQSLSFIFLAILCLCTASFEFLNDRKPKEETKDPQTQPVDLQFPPQEDLSEKGTIK